MLMLGENSVVSSRKFHKLTRYIAALTVLTEFSWLQYKCQWKSDFFLSCDGQVTNKTMRTRTTSQHISPLVGSSTGPCAFQWRVIPGPKFKDPLLPFIDQAGENLPKSKITAYDVLHLFGVYLRVQKPRGPDSTGTHRFKFLQFFDPLCMHVEGFCPHKGSKADPTPAAKHSTFGFSFCRNSEVNEMTSAPSQDGTSGVCRVRWFLRPLFLLSSQSLSNHSHRIEIKGVGRSISQSVCFQMDAILFSTTIKWCNLDQTTKIMPTFALCWCDWMCLWIHGKSVLSRFVTAPFSYVWVWCGCLHFTEKVGKTRTCVRTKPLTTGCTLQDRVSWMVNKFQRTVIYLARVAVSEATSFPPARRQMTLKITCKWWSYHDHDELVPTESSAARWFFFFSLSLSLSLSLSPRTTSTAVGFSLWYFTHKVNHFGPINHKTGSAHKLSFHCWAKNSFVDKQREAAVTVSPVCPIPFTQFCARTLLDHNISQVIPFLNTYSSACQEKWWPFSLV